MKITTALDPRLRAAAEYVRQGAVLADIGCDHALLPVFLLGSGKIKHAICADIAEGPLSVAEKNIVKNGFSDRTTMIKTNGLCGLGSLGITDITICGMGGELIADIIDSADFVKNSDIRLILQPMSRPEKLRSFLWENGFQIDDEKYCRAQGKIYCCLCAHYTGESYTYSAPEAELGKIFPRTYPDKNNPDEHSAHEDENDYFFDHLEKSIAKHKKAAVGMKKAGIPCTEHDDFILYAEQIRKRSHILPVNKQNQE